VDKFVHSLTTQGPLSSIILNLDYSLTIEGSLSLDLFGFENRPIFSFIGCVVTCLVECDLVKLLGLVC